MVRMRSLALGPTQPAANSCWSIVVLPFVSFVSSFYYSVSPSSFFCFDFLHCWFTCSTTQQATLLHIMFSFSLVLLAVFRYCCSHFSSYVLYLT